MEVLFSQPLSPLQYDLPPRWSPVAGTGLDKPREPHAEMQQAEQGGTFPFQAGVDDFLHVNCMKIPEQEGILSFQAGIRVNPETADTTLQVAARQEFAKLPMRRQQ